GLPQSHPATLEPASPWARLNCSQSEDRGRFGSNSVLADGRWRMSGSPPESRPRTGHAPTSGWRLTGREQAQQRTCHAGRLFDALVGVGEQCRRHIKTERFGGRQIDDELEFRRLLNWNVGWLSTAQNLVDEFGGAPIECREIWSIAHQTTRFDELSKTVDRR